MIRPYRESDLEDVIRIWLLSSIQAHDFICKDYWLTAEADMRELYLPLCDEIVVYAGEDDKALAFMAFADAYLAALFVTPSSQGKGIGTRLLRIARKMHPDLTLTVYEQNRRAIAFYEREGMFVTGKRVERATGCTEYLMSFAQKENVCRI